MSFRIELFVIDLDRSIRFDEDALGFVVERSEADYASQRRGAVLGMAPAAKLPPTVTAPGSPRSGWPACGARASRPGSRSTTT